MTSSEILAYRQRLYQRTGIASGEEADRRHFRRQSLFCNSGAEANEAALKLARKYAHDKFGAHKSGIVAFKNAFHGRTLFTVSAGGQPSYSQDFAPLPPDIRHAAYNDLHSASELIDDTTCAVIVEPMQGEGGVMPAQKAFLQGLRELCDRHNAVLILTKSRPAWAARVSCTPTCTMA